MTDSKKPEELSDSDLDDVKGGLLLPAVSAAREAARRTKSKSTTTKSSFSVGANSGSRIKSVGTHGDVTPDD